MISGKKVLAIIPARGGSKGLPDKNIKVLCGKPLIAWTILKAKLSKYVDTIMVTTDSEDIAQISKDYGADIPFIRPKELATDSSPSHDAIVHTLYFYENKGIVYDYIVLLEPTSPLREDDDIDNMLEKLSKNYCDYDSIISIGEIGEHPSIVKKIVNNNLQPFVSSLKQTTRRQDNVPAYFPYGVAYIAKTENLLNEKTFYTKRCSYYNLKQYQNFEIDDIYDFICVEGIMKYKWSIR